MSKKDYRVNEFTSRDHAIQLAKCEALDIVSKRKVLFMRQSTPSVPNITHSYFFYMIKQIEAIYQGYAPDQAHCGKTSTKQGVNAVLANGKATSREV